MFYSAADLLQASCRDAAEMLKICYCPAEEVQQNHLSILHTIFEASRSSLCFRMLQTCCRDAAGLQQRGCRPTAALLQRSCRITSRCYMPNLESLSQF